MSSPLKKLHGRKLMLCDVIYQKPSKKTEWSDYLTLLYRDLVTLKKEKLVIKEPTIKLYTVKEEFRTFKKARHFIENDKLTEREIKYKDVLFEIAKEAGPEAVEYYKSHGFKERKSLLKYPYCLGGDIPIETYYRTMWNNELGNDDKKSPSKIYLDIEVDQIDHDGSIARKGEVPVNAVTVVDDVTDNVYTFLLETNHLGGKYVNPQIPEFVKNQKEFMDLCHDNFDERYGKKDYKIYMFDNEIEMLIQLFRLINTLCRDFCLIWNMSFDIPYLLERLEKLGIDPSTVVCGKDFPVQSYYYYEDHRSFDFANKRDYFSCASNTHYSDQVINYAGLRKSQGAVKKVSLDAIGEKEIGAKKLDYHAEATIKTLPYVNYVLFVLYNINDVLLQQGIERKVKDVDNIYNIANVNNIGYTDTLKQTVTFRGLLYACLVAKDITLGHNVNFDNDQGSNKFKFDEDGELIRGDNDDDDDETFEGAINGDPLLNMANGLFMYGLPSKFLYGLVIDFDFSSMYPFSITAFNIFATTMIGKLIIAKYKPENNYDDDIGKEYIEDLIIGDLIHIGHKWHNLSTIDKLALKIKVRYNLS